MNASKERLRTALAHKEPDRVPMMMSASGWVVERLKKHLGVQTDLELHKALHLDVYDMRGIDYKGGVAPRYIGPDDIGVPDGWCGDTFMLFDYHEHITENEYGRAYSMGAPCLDPEKYKTVEDLEKFRWPQADWFDYSHLRGDLKPWADEFAIACTGCSVLTHPSLFRGIEQMLYEMAADPELAAYIIDKVTDFYYEYSKRMFEVAGDLMDLYRVADDIGAQTSLFISPQMLDEFVGPRVKKCADLAHEYNIHTMFHTDGNVRQAVPAIIDWGIDLLDPNQPEVPDMDARELKAEFGDRLAFSGGVGAQEILPKGRKEDVRAEVKRVIEAFGPGGGYVLSPGHPSLQLDIPAENVVAMYEAGLELGRY